MRMHDLRSRRHSWPAPPRAASADRRVVVVAVAGGVDHRLAAVGRRVVVRPRRRLVGERSRASASHISAARRRGRRPATFSTSAARGLLRAVASPNWRAARAWRRHGLPLRSVSASSRSAKRHAVLLRLDGAIAQHQMREIEIELMRRHIGAFRQEAHVAERAGVHDRLEIRALDACPARRFVDSSTRSNRRGKESHRLKQRRQP